MPKSKKVAIINYGAGNIGSVVNAISHLNNQPVVIDNPKNAEDFSHVILPGVGNFGKLSKNLTDTGFRDYLDKNKSKGNYILGICVGMQLLFSKSEEDKQSEGLSYFEGKIELFNFANINLPVPHVGFNKVTHKNSKIWINIPNNVYYYFIHSYCLKKTDQKFISATSNYGENFISFVESENIFGAQFHPEKSHKNGLKLLSNFIDLK